MVGILTFTSHRHCRLQRAAFSILLRTYLLASLIAYHSRKAAVQQVFKEGIVALIESVPNCERCSRLNEVFGESSSWLFRGKESGWVGWYSD